MALSNIFREPRREITESVVGVGALLVFGGGYVRLIVWLADSLYRPGDNYSGDLFACFLFSIVAMIVIWIVVAVAHRIGEAICNALQASGIHLRPRQRP